MPPVTGFDGLNTSSGPPGTTANEGISKLGCIAGRPLQEPSQPQSVRLTRMHEYSPSLESSIISQNRMPSGSGRFEESGDDGCIPHGLWSCVRGQNSEMSLVFGTEGRANKFPRATDSISGSETFCAISQKSSRIGQNGQYNGDSLYKMAGRLTLSQTSHVSEEADNVGQRKPPVVVHDACSRNNEQGSGFAIQREPAVRGVAEIRSSCRRSLRISLAVDDAPLGVDTLAHEWPDALLYAFPSLSLIELILRRVRECGHTMILIAPYWPGRLWVAEIAQLLCDQPWPLPARSDLLSQVRGEIFHPSPQKLSLWA